jgi:hypothetical protein
MNRMTFLTLDFEVVISPDQYIVHRKETKNIKKIRLKIILHIYLILSRVYIIGG